MVLMLTYPGGWRKLSTAHAGDLEKRFHPKPPTPHTPTTQQQKPNFLTYYQLPPNFLIYYQLPANFLIYYQLPHHPSPTHITFINFVIVNLPNL